MRRDAEREMRWESNFGVEPPFAIGVEEELLLVGSDRSSPARRSGASPTPIPPRGS